MGCWNGTCGLTQLPILYNENILLFVIRKKEHAETSGGGFCYAHDQYEPIAPPIHGRYNDYGYIQDITSNQEALFTHLTSLGLTVDTREADRLNVTNTPPTTLEEFIHYIERDVYKDVGFMMVREAVFEELVDAISSENLELIQDLDTFIVEYKKKMKQSEWRKQVIREEAAKRPAVDEELIKELESQVSDETFSIENYGFQHFRDLKTNKFVRIVGNYDPHWFDMRALLDSMCQADNDDIRDSVLDLLLMERILESLRKSWSLQAGAGSQDSNVKLHKVLASAMEHEADAIASYYDDDYDDEEDGS